LLFAQVLQWQYTYDGHGSDVAWKLLYDGDNGIYTLGISEDTDATLWDLVLIKLDTLGSECWIWRSDAEGISYTATGDMVLDNQGHVYLTTENATFKLDTSGSLLWAYPSGGSSITLGNFGDLYIAGDMTEDSLFSVLSLDTFGSFRWSYSQDSGVALVVRVDQNRGVYAGGRKKEKATISDTSAVVLRLDTVGTPLWEKRIRVPASLKPDAFMAHRIVVDSENHIYGGTCKAFGTAADDLIGFFRMDTLGNLDWLTSSMGFGDEDLESGGLWDILLTQHGVYGCGTALVRFALLFAWGIYALDLEGNVKWGWTSRYDEPTGVYCEARAIASDPEENLFVVGRVPQYQSYGSVPTYPMAMKFTPAGTREWKYPWPDTGDFISVAVDTSGGVYIAGNWNDDIQVIKLRDSLTTVHEGCAKDTRLLLAPAPDGFFISGYEGEARIYDPAGRLVLSREINGKALISPLRPGVYFVVAGKEKARVAVR
jgi:hypothetical protein